MRLNPKDIMTEEQTAALVSAMNGTERLLGMMLESIKEFDGRLEAIESATRAESAVPPAGWMVDYRTGKLKPLPEALS